MNAGVPRALQSDTRSKIAELDLAQRESRNVIALRCHPQAIQSGQLRHDDLPDLYSAVPSVALLVFILMSSLTFASCQNTSKSTLWVVIYTKKFNPSQGVLEHVLE